MIPALQTNMPPKKLQFFWAQRIFESQSDVRILKTLTWAWSFTPLKINMQPKNGGLEDDYPFHVVDF